MLTKERILELLGNAPEKLERWEQELILAKNTEEPLGYIQNRLRHLKIPIKKRHSSYQLPPEAHDALKKENIDRSKYIELQEKYEVTLATLLHPKGGFRKMPNKKDVLDSYYTWSAIKGTPRGWAAAYSKEINVDRSTLRRFLKSRNISLIRSDKVTKEPVQYLKNLLEESCKEENFTKYRTLADYIEANYNTNDECPKRSREALQKLIRQIDNKCGQKFKELQEEFIQKLLDGRDITISKTQTARCWEKLYPMRACETYKTILCSGNLKKYKQIQINVNKKRKKDCYDLFVEALPPSLTKEQWNRIIAAYEKARN